MKKLCVLAVCALPLVGLANTNVVWKKSVGLGVTYKDGNTEKTLYTANIKGDRTSEKSEWINSLYAEYGKTRGADETEKKQTEGNVRGQTEYKYTFGNSRMYGSANGEAFHDAIKDISYRVRGGPNVGYFFVRNDTMALDASFGVNYQSERVAGAEDDFAVYRAAGHYGWTISETAEYYFDIEYNARVDDVDQGDGLMVTGLKTKVNDQFALYVELRDEYDNRPAVGTDNNDITLLAGLSYDF